MSTAARNATLGTLVLLTYWILVAAVVASF